jgi:Protein of unknown function, DUF255
MAHESPEDETTAALMNAHFVNIKLDREERPDRWLEENLCAVMPIGRIESIEPLRGEAVPDMAVALAGATQILVPRAGAPGSSSRTATPGSHQCLRPSCRPAPAP